MSLACCASSLHSSSGVLGEGIGVVLYGSECPGGNRWTLDLPTYLVAVVVVAWRLLGLVLVVGRWIMAVTT